MFRPTTDTGAKGYRPGYHMAKLWKHGQDLDAELITGITQQAHKMGANSFYITVKSSGNYWDNAWVREDQVHLLNANK